MKQNKMNEFFGPYKSKPSDFPELGKDYNPPEYFIHGKQHLVASLKSKKGSDGQDVNVYETRCSCSFFSIEALPTEDKRAFTLATGSGSDTRRLTADIAKAIVGGLLGLGFTTYR